MRKVIIDCDPGHDDAVALILAIKNPNIDVLGVTIESGNQTLEKTANNANNILNFLGSDITFALGASKPLNRDNLICPEIHGESGLDGYIFPKYKSNYIFEHATDFIIKTCLENDKVTILTCGPLTNVALAILKDKNILTHIDEIISMGGSTGEGNMSPYAEFNILCDPEAADIVFNSGVKIKMIGLNVTRRILVLPKILEKAELISSNTSKLFIDLMNVFNKNQQDFFGLEAAPLHDPVTVISAISDDVIKFEKMKIEVVITHDEYYGQTKCIPVDVDTDIKTYVAVDVVIDKYWDIVLDCLK